MKKDSTIWLKGLAKTTGKWHKLTKIIAFILAGLIIVQAALLSWLINDIIMLEVPAADLLPKFLLLAFVITIRYFLAWLRSNFAYKSSLIVQQNLRTELMDKLYSLGPAWRAERQAGALVSQMHEQVSSLDGYLSKYIPQMGLVMAIPTFIIIAVFPFSWVAALLFFITAPLVPVFMILVGLRAKDKQVEQHRHLARMSGHFLDQIRGLPILQIFNRHKNQVEVIERVSEGFRDKTMKVLRLAFLSSTVLEFFTSISIALTAVYLGFYFLGEFNFGVFGDKLTLQVGFFILLLAPEFYQPLRDLGTYYHAKSEAEAAATHLYPWILAQPSQVEGGKQVVARHALDIELQNISFSYNTTPVIENIDLKLEAGKTCVLFGASGSGKTTILRLILGQIRAKSGAILIDGKNLNELDIYAWRESVGWMSQEPHLFSSSLADNLRVNAPNASDAELIDALKFVELEQWFANLPEGLNTKLGETGRRVSGGQLRRIALARVYLSKANILLFDEPTASLDEDLELKILEKMRILCKNKTVLLLTHRKAPLDLADEVAIFENGKIKLGVLTQLQQESELFAKYMAQGGIYE